MAVHRNMRITAGTQPTVHSSKNTENKNQTTQQSQLKRNMALVGVFLDTIQRSELCYLHHHAPVLLSPSQTCVTFTITHLCYSNSYAPEPNPGPQNHEPSEATGNHSSGLCGTCHCTVCGTVTALSVVLVTALSVVLVTALSVVLVTALSVVLVTALSVVLVTALSVVLVTALSEVLVTALSVVLVTALSVVLVTALSVVLVTALSVVLVTALSVVLVTALSVVLVTALSVVLVTALSVVLVTALSVVLVTALSVVLVTALSVVLVTALSVVLVTALSVVLVTALSVVLVTALSVVLVTALSVVLVTALSVGEQKAWPATTVDNGFMLTARASTPDATESWRSSERKYLCFAPYVGAPTAKLCTTFTAWNTVPCTLCQSYQKTAQHKQSSTWTDLYTAPPLPEPASKINGREDH